MCAAHLHGVGQLTGQLVDVALDALGTAAVDSRDEGAADEHAVRAQCQCLENVHTGADAAVHQDLDAGTLEGGGDLRQDFGGSRTLVEDAAAVVGYHDGRGTGLLGLESTLDGHDALDDEGTLGQLDDLSQFGHALAAGRRRHILEEGQAGGIHVHCHGEAAAGLGLCHLFFNGVDVPGLDGRHAAAIGVADGLGGHGHDVGHHPDMSRISDKAAFEKELTALETLYQSVTGQTMKKYYRPPQGKYSESNLQMAKELGYKTFFWSLAYVDWMQDQQPSKEEAFSKLLTRIHPGAIVLLHSTSQTNAQILDELLAKWEEMGYQFGRLDEL